MFDQPDELADRITEPAYRPYRYTRSLLCPGTRVLDIGCGNGKVSAYLAESGAVVDGVEPAANRAGLAGAQVRHLSTDDPTQVDDPELLEQYDVITFFDVLEHIVDPLPLLTWSVRRLAPDGVIVAAIPNSGHWTFRRKMLRGDWTMSDFGLFDRTHVRFFDITTAPLLRPEGTSEIGRFFSTPGAAWERTAMRWRPSLFALHLTLTWRRL